MLKIAISVISNFVYVWKVEKETVYEYNCKNTKYNLRNVLEKLKSVG